MCHSMNSRRQVVKAGINDGVEDQTKLLLGMTHLSNTYLKTETELFFTEIWHIFSGLFFLNHPVFFQLFPQLI